MGKKPSGAKPPPADTTRKNLTLHNDLWAEIAEYRHDQRIGTEAEAVRRLIVAGLKAEGYGGGKPPARRTRS